LRVLATAPHAREQHGIVPAIVEYDVLALRDVEVAPRNAVGQQLAQSSLDLRPLCLFEEFEAELRLLRLPAVYLMALWLKDLDDDDGEGEGVIPLEPAPEPLNALPPGRPA
jgi:hypothetical protein